MSSYKIIDTLNYYSSLCGIDRDPTEEERDFVHNIEIEIAKSIIGDFGQNSSKKIAKVILAVIE